MLHMFKAGQTIKENCKCRHQVTGTINEKGYAVFQCPFCNNSWQYSMVGKGRGSSFSSADLSRILKTRSVTIGN
jgi:hypothetical protein